jgi:hypothetical protein
MSPPATSRSIGRLITIVVKDAPQQCPVRSWNWSRLRRGGRPPRSLGTAQESVLSRFPYFATIGSHARAVSF